MVQVTELNRKPDIDADVIDAGSVSADDGTFNDSITDPTGTTFTDLAALQKIRYVQSATPSNPSEGEAWYDTDNGIYRVYADLGSGLDWQPVPPVQVLEEAVTFAESEITATNNDTVVNNNSIELGRPSTVTRPDDDNTKNTSSGYGIIINPNVNINQIEVTLSSNNGTFQDVFVADAAENILDEDTTGHTAGDTVVLNASLSAGTKYYVAAYDDGGIYDFGEYTSPSYPYQSVNLDIVGDVLYAHPNDGSAADEREDTAKVIKSITAGQDATTGNALIERDDLPPEDIEGWLDAGGQRTLDGESAWMDIEDGNGNVLEADIGKGTGTESVAHDLDIDPDVSDTDNIKLRLYLERQDTANNPTWDSTFWRYLR